MSSSLLCWGCLFLEKLSHQFLVVNSVLLFICELHQVNAVDSQTAKLHDSHEILNLNFAASLLIHDQKKIHSLLNLLLYCSFFACASSGVYRLKSSFGKVSRIPLKLRQICKLFRTEPSWALSARDFEH